MKQRNSGEKTQMEVCTGFYVCVCVYLLIMYQLEQLLFLFFNFD